MRARLFKHMLLAVLMPYALSNCTQRDSAGNIEENTVALSWNAPTTSADGSGLMSLAGYRIYYGTVLGVYPRMVEVNDPAETKLVVADLPPATYYFVATAYDAEGNESKYSNVAIKTIP